MSGSFGKPEIMEYIEAEVRRQHEQLEAALARALAEALETRVEGGMVVCHTSQVIDVAWLDGRALRRSEFVPRGMAYEISREVLQALGHGNPVPSAPADQLS